MLCLRYSKDLGKQLADLHLHNKKQLEKLNKEQQTVGKSTKKSFKFIMHECLQQL